MNIDDDMLMAYADNELEPGLRAGVEQALRDDPALRERLEAQQRLRSTLSAHYGPVASEEVPERLLALLGASPADETVASLGAARERRRRASPWGWRNAGAIAATLAVGFLAGQLVSGRSGAPVGTENGMLVAEGPLANALETQLASAQPADAATRIGVSFEDREGRLCRTFDASQLSGLACRRGENWMLVTTAAPQSGAVLVTTAAPQSGAVTEYRQAGSSLVLQAAQEMMAGTPLDAAAERAAMQADWKIPPPAD